MRSLTDLNEWQARIERMFFTQHMDTLAIARVTRSHEHAIERVLNFLVDRRFKQRTTAGA